MAHAVFIWSKIDDQHSHYILKEKIPHFRNKRDKKQPTKYRKPALLLSQYFFFSLRALPKKFTLICKSNLSLKNRYANKIDKMYIINHCNTIYFLSHKAMNTILVISYKFLNDEKRDLIMKFSFPIFSKITIKQGFQSIKIQLFVECVFQKLNLYFTTVSSVTRCNTLQSSNHQCDVKNAINQPL